ncbi:hypothetical protein [Streptomyces sp. NPDC059009]|uniref:hypothetical protein n=1 Tax=Streptomyces sp. NPDC059009 TaxID=3346694 RepID=UPI0036C0014B
MSDELAMLAEAGAAAVVAAMATDMWQETRNAFVRLFRRSGRERRAALETQLDANAALVQGSETPEDVQRALFAYWTLELAELLRHDPADREAVARLAASVDTGRGPGRAPAPTQTNAARDSATVNAVQYGTQYACGPAHPASQDRE